MMILYGENFCKFALEANSFKKFIFMLRFIKKNISCPDDLISWRLSCWDCGGRGRGSGSVRRRVQRLVGKVTTEASGEEVLLA